VLPDEHGTRAERAGQVVDRLRAAFDTGRTRPLGWRAEQWKALLRMLTERESEFAAALGADLGRSPLDAALLDLAPTRAEVRHALASLRSWPRRRPVWTPLPALPGRSWYRYEPLGVVLIIGPWNYPVHLLLAPLVGAMAADNCAVLKPSEIARRCSAAIAEAVADYLDPDAFTVVARHRGGTSVLGGSIDAEAAQGEPTTVESLDEAITHVRRGTRPLASYLFTEDRAEEERVLTEITAGATIANHVRLHHAVNDLPFGGVRTSGMGRYHGRWGFETFSNARAVFRKPSRPDVRLMYPPYGRLVRHLMPRILR
jgi:acyl-CoA reductase-like NAD-dependent aldehyde dehydrogenase